MLGIAFSVEYVFNVFTFLIFRDMRYYFNYSFLEKWIQANSDITDRQILHAIGTTSNRRLDYWERMEAPIPTIQLLRFCNAFQVPISAFIVDADANYDKGIEEIDYVQPSVDDQFEPAGGYISQNEKRPIGGRALRDPLDVDYIKSIIPGLATIKIGQNVQTGGSRQSATAPHAFINQSASTLPKRETDVSFSTLNKMLDIIAEQQKQMAGQQALIAEQQQEIATLTHRILSISDMRYSTDAAGMAADPLRHDDK